MFALCATRAVLRSPARTMSARFESTGFSAPIPGIEGQRRTSIHRPKRPYVGRTHFLTIPLYEHSPELTENIAAFRKSILENDITGLTEDVLSEISQVVDLRIGQLNIEGYEQYQWQKRRPFKGQPMEPTRAELGPIPVEEVLQVLQELKTPIQEILMAGGGDGALHVPMGCLRPLLHGPRTTFNPHKVNLLFLEPSHGLQSQFAYEINELVFKRFAQAGMWVDTHRPATLSVTLAGTLSLRARASQPEHVHFSILDLYESNAFRQVQGAPPQELGGIRVDDATPRPVKLGEGIVRSLHIIPIGKRGDDPIQPDFKLEF